MQWIMTHWLTLLIIVGCMALIVFFFRRFLLEYNTVFFSGKALQWALIKTVVIVLFVFGLFYGFDRLFAWWMEPGYWREVLAFLLPYLLMRIFWEPLIWAIDRLALS
jgi:hypothetical protein